MGQLMDKLASAGVGQRPVIFICHRSVLTSCRCQVTAYLCFLLVEGAFSKLLQRKSYSLGRAMQHFVCSISLILYVHAVWVAFSQRRSWARPWQRLLPPISASLQSRHQGLFSMPVPTKGHGWQTLDGRCGLWVPALPLLCYTSSEGLT